MEESNMREGEQYPRTTLTEPPTPTYDVSNDVVNLDGSIAFDNPGYATHKDISRLRNQQNHSQAAAAPQKQELEDIDKVDFNKNKSALKQTKRGIDRDGFANPIYDRQNAHMEQTAESAETQEDNPYEQLPEFTTLQL